MDKMVAYCGIVCSDCPAYIATRDNNDELRKETATKWSEEYKAEIKPEHVNCVGCVVADGVHVKHWDECGIRACGQAKGVENCGRCEDYVCEQLGKFLEMVPAAKVTLDEMRKVVDET